MIKVENKESLPSFCWNFKDWNLWKSPVQLRMWNLPRVQKMISQVANASAASGQKDEPWEPIYTQLNNFAEIFHSSPTDPQISKDYKVTWQAPYGRKSTQNIMQYLYSNMISRKFLAQNYFAFRSPINWTSPTWMASAWDEAEAGIFWCLGGHRGLWWWAMSSDGRVADVWQLVSRWILWGSSDWNYQKTGGRENLGELGQDSFWKKF